MARRELENTVLPIPNGWFAVDWSRDLIAGQVKSIHYFGEDLVIFRGRSGEVHVLDPYCPHLGAHLGEGGRVMGDALRCPFHGWTFDGASGRCTQIPYCERIPAKAAVRSWPVVEKNGMIFVWHHIHGEAPAWDFPLLEEIGHADWSAPRTFELEVPVHVQDMHENNNDPVHFQFVHGNTEPLPSEISYAADGRAYRISSTQVRDTPYGRFETTLIRDSWGIGLSAVRTEGIPGAGLLMFSSTTPIDAGRTLSRWLLTATNNMIDLAGEDFMNGLTSGVMQDLRIWSHKVHRARPMLCEADNYLAEFRQWVKQFYSDGEADVPQHRADPRARVRAMERFLVISSDCHAGLPPERYRDYLDPQYRDVFDIALPLQIAEMEKMSKMFLIDDINRKWREEVGDGLAGAWDHDARIRVLDADGIAGEIIFPDGITEMNTPPFGAGLSLPVEERIVPELQWAGARAHNRWIAELVAMAPERRVGVALVPALWDVAEAVKEVEWCAANGVKGVLLPCMWRHLDPYHHPKYEPLWSACEDTNTVIHFHSGPAPMEDAFGPLANPDGVVRPGAMGIYVSEVVWWAVRPLTYLIWGGVLERHPRLRVAITESTTVWAPEYLALLDQRYSETHFAAKLGDYRSHLRSKPSEYFHRQVALGASCMSRREAEMRHAIGLANIMWGSDYPHPEGTWPVTAPQMDEAFGGLPRGEVADMLGGNAARFYGFDTKALAPLVARIGPEVSRFAARSAA